MKRQKVNQSYLLVQPMIIPISMHNKTNSKMHLNCILTREVMLMLKMSKTKNST